ALRTWKPSTVFPCSASRRSASATSRRRMRTMPLAISSRRDDAGRSTSTTGLHLNDCDCNGCACNRTRVEPAAVRQTRFAMLRSVLALLTVAASALGQERLTLEDAVRRAIARNPTALIAEQEIRRAEGLLREARAPALPFLSANGAGTRLDSARTSSAGVLVARESLAANLTLSMPLIAPQRWLAWAHAGDQVDIAHISLEDARRTVGVA